MRSRSLKIAAICVAAATAITCGTSSAVVGVSGAADTLIITGGVDSVLSTSVDTVIAPPDTVVVTVVDTIVSGTDTTFVTTTDTIVTVDTVIVVDTVLVATTLVASVSTLSLEVGQTATFAVTVLNPLGIPSSPADVNWISDPPDIVTLTSSGNSVDVSAEAVGSTTIFALSEGLSVVVPTVVTAATGPPPPPPPPPPPGSIEPTFLFHIDWGTATGQTTDAYLDTSKEIPWDEHTGGDSRVPTDTVVTVASQQADYSLVWPSENVLKVMNESSSSDIYRIRFENNHMPPIAVGQSRWYRFYLRVIAPDSITDGIHGYQPQTSSAGNWWFSNHLTDSPGSYKVELGFPREPTYRVSDMRLPTELSKDTTYRIEVEHQRTHTDSMNFHVRIYGQDDVTLQYSDVDFIFRDRSDNMLNLPNLVMVDERPTQSFQAGVNGVTDFQTGPPVALMFQGAIAICSFTWCGPYRGGR